MIADQEMFPHEGMKFFTPELYLKFQSEDDDAALEAQEVWDGRLVAYAEHLRRLKKYDRAERLSQLADLRLHDYQVTGYGRDSLNQGRDDFYHYLIPYEVRGLEQKRELASLRAPFTVRLKGPKGYLTLAYFLWSHVAVSPFNAWRTGTIGNTFWLYDELDVAWPGTDLYVHRILLSDGYVLMIPFIHAEIVGDGSPVGESLREQA